MFEPRWYCFDVHWKGSARFIGRCLTTEAEIREHFPRSIITGNHVLICR